MSTLLAMVRRGFAAAAGFALAAAAIALAPVPAHAQAMPEAPACFDGWVEHVGAALNSHSGDAEFNSRKAWTINRYGLFVGRGISSNAEPDNWSQNGSSRNQWMWNTYTSEEEFPDWNNANFNSAGLKGLRWFVRNCSGAVLAAAPTSPGTTMAAGVAPALDTSAACPRNFRMHEGSTLTIICYCAPDALSGTVWGSGIYTHDSALCAAALHAGAVGTGGGMITVRGAPGQAGYQGTQSNGITSSNYGRYDWSIVFPGTVIPAAAPAVAACPSNMTDLRGTTEARICHCAPDRMDGSVWGTGTYTDDSALCAAALHAGAVAPSGGTVTAVPAPGLSKYEGSTRNGITSSNYGSWYGSYTFR